MSIIDVDRHILAEIVEYGKKNKESFKGFADAWSLLIDASERGDLLYWTNCVDQKKKEKKLKGIRKRFFNAIQIISHLITDISINTAKQDALLVHLVSLVEEADTGKGKENLKK